MAPMSKQEGSGSGLDAPHTIAEDNICISGISGCFPNSDSVSHLAENLFNKVDLISDDERRWKKANPEIPQRTGKLNHIDRFDASFFGIDYNQAHCMDEMSRIILEKVFESIIDAGYNPCEFRNTRTGVFMGTCVVESEAKRLYEKMELIDSALAGVSRSMMANRVSHWLDLRGPSYAVDTACSSSLYALEHAVAAIRNGRCDAAIVGCTNLLLHPVMSLQFARLGVLSPDGACKSFDNNANGYVRSETIAVCLLQKAKDSRRVYAEIVHAKTNCDGYKEQGITYPAGQIQKMLLQEFYEECKIPPSSLEFVEAHGTGTQVGDPEELNAIDEIFCKDRKGKLLIGSIKSNLGHSEPSSGLCSITKVCIAYNTGFIPPNINYKRPREGISGLRDGRLQVVTEKMPWNRGLAGASSFGFGGANAHVLLRNIARNKLNNGLPLDDLPRLVCVSGRTEAAVTAILDDLESRTVDVDQIRLWHAIHAKDIPGHNYKGYILLRSQPAKSETLVRHIQAINYQRKEQRDVCFIYSNLGTHWLSLARQFMSVTIFASSIQRCNNVLQLKSVNLMNIINCPDNGTTKAVEDQYFVIGVVAVHIAITDVLIAIGIKPDHVIGDEVGALSCGYADASMTLEESISAAYNLAFTNNISENSTSFKDKASSISSNAIVVEVGLEKLANTLKKGDHALPVLDHQDCIRFFMNALGKLYVRGINMKLADIYPEVPFPVAQGTAMLSHLVKWEHNERWFKVSYDNEKKLTTYERTKSLSLQDEDQDYIQGHCIDGRVIHPATGYLILVWETLAQISGKLYMKMSVVFEDVYFLRATNVPKEGRLTFTVVINRGSGDFELTENGTSVVTGRVYEKKDARQEYRVIPKSESKGNASKIMLKKDFYKELSLRGYNYGGMFRGVLGCTVDGTRGLLKWENNWVTFLDTMLQTRIVSHDSRTLYVPTRIEKLAIDVDVHENITSNKNLETSNSIPFCFYPHVEVTRSGGAEIRGIHVTAISKKLPLGIPILEKNIFIPNIYNDNFEITDSLRSQIQLILENIQTYKFKTIEVVDEEYKNNGLSPIIEMVGDVLGDLPLIQAELIILSEEEFEVPSNVTLSNKKIKGESNVILLLGANLLKRPEVLGEATSTLKNGCFILSRETSSLHIGDPTPDYDIINIHKTGAENLVLLRKSTMHIPTKYIEIETADKSYSWINKIKNEMMEGKKIVLYNQKSINGLLGLVNCLRKEPGGEIIHGLLIADPNAPVFNPDLQFYKEQLDKNLAVNVFKNGQWGTYRHLLLKDLDTVPAVHAYVNTATIGDLSSLRWWEGSIKKYQINKNRQQKIVHVYCSAMNFRDVMTAMGRVTLDAVARGRLAQDCVQGIEISGRAANGTRVMAVCEKGISNLVQTDESMMWPIPDEWSFEEAATVPVAYSTVYMALVMIGKIRRGESILVHAGSGGVGQAAISVALHYGLEVFTTVGTPAKRAFIKRLFPQLKNSHIGNSRDTSFEHMIRRETNGKGVDVVLNSLADEKLQASAKCLCKRGRFLEIGKYDITINTQLEMCFLKNEISFHGVMLDFISDSESGRLRKELSKLIMSGINNGAVRPLTYCTFEKNEVEAAYRYMAAGKHIGKVIIKIRNDESASVKPSFTVIDAVPRYMCNEDEVYVILGGLGGFGLELADWLVLRGARKILMSSRRGVSNGYQALRLKIWTSYGTEIRISTHDITTEQGCEKMLKMANAMGQVRAIFNLAVILNDAVFTNQTPETFKNSFGPKAAATIYLDKLTRKLCPHLKDFVIFSSVSCGRGNAGQTNYGFSNSVMERICEERKQEGLPALAIQWGAIGDVGLVADMQEDNVQLEIGGTLQQRISSCLQALDKFLKQDEAIVSSIVVAEKKAAGAGTTSIVAAVAQIMGISDLKTVSQQVPLSELGMDSIMAVEIKQTLEREFEVFLAAQEIRTLTFSRLSEFATQSEMTTETNSIVPTTAVETNLGAANALKMLIRNLGDEENANKPFILIPCDNINKKTTSTKTIFMLPGVEGNAATLKPLCSKLTTEACVMQLSLEDANEDIDHMVQKIYKTVSERLPLASPFYLLGYSFGTIPILRLAEKLENEGRRGIVFCLDGSPQYFSSMASNILQWNDEFSMQNSLIIYCIHSFIKSGTPDHVLEKFNRNQPFEERIKIALDMYPISPLYSKKFLTDMCLAIYHRINKGKEFNSTGMKRINSPIVLLRTTAPSIVTDEDFGLNKLSENPVTLHYFETDHIGIVENDKCANVINAYIEKFNENEQNFSLHKKRAIGTE